MSGKPAARQGDMTQYGGSIVQGSAGVRIGAPTGVACSVCPGGVTSGHPVNPLLGAKVLPGETDIALPGPLPFILSRTYSSYRTKTPAPVGSLGQVTDRFVEALSGRPEIGEVYSSFAADYPQY